MKPQSPAVHGWPTTNIAEHQDEYNTLPATILSDGTVITRWRLSLKERLTVLFKGDIFLSVWTFRQPLQPVLLDVKAPKIKGYATEPHAEVPNA
jgi:hypothetical protein